MSASETHKIGLCTFFAVVGLSCFMLNTVWSWAYPTQSHIQYSADISPLFTTLAKSTSTQSEVKRLKKRRERREKKRKKKREEKRRERREEKKEEMTTAKRKRIRERREK